MLKGQVFSRQLFENQIFALFINTFLNGENGVSDNYLNGMAVSYNGNNITVSSGAVCIQGRFLEEDTSSTISAGTDTSYCKLVIEIDLDKTNTDSDFQQGSYKIIKGASSYPALTQTDIVKNNAGIYQYELARFRNSASGITDFQDMRTFLNFDSIYTAIQTEYRNLLEQLQEELKDVEDGSAYLLKTGGTITGDLTVNGEITGNQSVRTQTLTYRNSEEGVYIDINFKRVGNVVECFINSKIAGGAIHTRTTNEFSGEFPLWAYPNINFSKQQLHYSDNSIKASLSSILFNDGRIFLLYNNQTSDEISIVLQFTYIVEDSSTEYEKGDIDGNGKVNETDLEMLNNYFSGVTLSNKQFYAADMNGDGKVDALDSYLLIQKINNNT